MTAPVVIFAIGNPSRGDDALGPEICGRLQEWLENEGIADRFELVEDFQLQIEHALDLQARTLALFIDAGMNTPAPFVFRQIQPSTAVAHTTHALAPEAVLQVYLQTEDCMPPLAFVLEVRGDDFELGQALSLTAQENARVAFEFLQKLTHLASLDAWLALCDEPLAGKSNFQPVSA